MFLLNFYILYESPRVHPLAISLKNHHILSFDFLNPPIYKITFYNKIFIMASFYSSILLGTFLYISNLWIVQYNPCIVLLCPALISYIMLLLIPYLHCSFYIFSFSTCWFWCVLIYILNFLYFSLHLYIIFLHFPNLYDVFVFLYFSKNFATDFLYFNLSVILLPIRKHL